MAHMCIAQHVYVVSMPKCFRGHYDIRCKSARLLLIWGPCVFIYARHACTWQLNLNACAWDPRTLYIHYAIEAQPYGAPIG